MTDLGEQLIGTWQIKATNFPMWLSGKRENPQITYELLNREPLKLSDLVEYKRKGKRKSIVGIDHFNQSEVEWRGKGLLKWLSSHWQIVSLDETLLVIRFEKSLVTPAGIDVLVRQGLRICTPELIQALNKADLSPDEIKSLTWL